MPVPAHILRLVEAHSCFSGCYSPDGDVMCLIDPARPPELATYVQCQDCLTFRVGSVATLLGRGMDCYKLAREVSDHLRSARNYTLSFAGYHLQGGFWLSAAYWGHMGVFLLMADRGSHAAHQDPVDRLVKAFVNGVSAPPAAGMCDRNNYASHKVFLNAAALSAPADARALFASSAVSQKPAPGYTAVTLAEFLPVSQGALSQAALSQSTLPWAAPSGAVPSRAVPSPATSSRAPQSPAARSPAALSPAALSPAALSQTPPSRGAPPGAVSGAMRAPGSAGAGTSRSASSRAAAAVARPLGSRCDVCGELVTERALLTSVYIGCRCG